MGLLDDAIRQHLELKRRSGASDDEIRKLENEALGDPRSRPVKAPEPAEGDEPAARALGGHEDDADAGESPVPVPAEAAIERDPVVAAEEEWLEEPDEVPASEALDPGLAPPVSRELRAPEPAPDPPRADPPRADPRDFETDDIFADPEPAAPAADETADEDVLEETPDFLQETPEHDRRWFEQKPPRDFDFGA